MGENRRIGLYDGCFRVIIICFFDLRLFSCDFSAFWVLGGIVNHFCRESPSERLILGNLVKIC